MGDRERIGLRHIKTLLPGQVLWDSAVIGFGARRQRSEAVSFFLFYRTQDGRQRWHTIGRHGAPWTPDTARAEARRLLGDVARGSDPAGSRQANRKAQTVAELCDVYLADAMAGRVLTRGRAKKASTLTIDKGRIERHIKPLLGRLKVSAVTSADVQDLLHGVAAGKTARMVKTGPRGLARVTGGEGSANRVVRLLGGIFTFAIKRGICTSNPVRGVEQFAEQPKERRLSDAEYRALGKTLDTIQDKAWPAVIAVTRFLALVGWRSGEALALRWEHVDLDRRTAFLSDTKTGRSMRPLSVAACDVLQSLPFQRVGLVFPASRGDGLMTGFKGAFRKLAKRGKLPPDVTPHTLRHAFCSAAADLGYSDLTIGALIGHKGRSMTSRYAHGADAVLLAAADAVANHINGLMRGDGSRDGDSIPAEK